MAKHDSDIPNDAEADDAEEGAVPDAPRNEPTPQSDAHHGEPTPRPDSHSRPAPEADVTRPDQQEELGPVEGLVHASAVEAKAEVTDDPETEAEAARLGIESEGVEAAQIFSILLATVVTLTLAVLGVFVLVAYFSDAETVERSSGATYAEVQEVRNRATEMLTQYGRTEDVYRIPITEAMGLVAADYAERGQDARPAPTNFRTVYLGSYLGESGFDEFGAGAEDSPESGTAVGEDSEALQTGTPDEPAPDDEAATSDEEDVPADEGGVVEEPEEQ